MAVADPGLASGPKLPGINISITGPSPSPVPRLNGRFSLQYWTLVLKPKKVLNKRRHHIRQGPSQTRNVAFNLNVLATNHSSSMHFFNISMLLALALAAMTNAAPSGLSSALLFRGRFLLLLPHRHRSVIDQARGIPVHSLAALSPPPAQQSLKMNRDRSPLLFPGSQRHNRR
ncbi:hypothetical protein BC829DRAFT_488964 [Chytridium lagenaria]|nr:hypothetical protein BC829DRAFT_488964 [Chytridium lagenaria]